MAKIRQGNSYHLSNKPIVGTGIETPVNKDDKKSTIGTMQGYKVKKGEDKKTSFFKKSDKPQSWSLPMEPDKVSSVAPVSSTKRYCTSEKPSNNKEVIDLVDADAISDAAKLAVHFANPSLLMPINTYQSKLGATVEEESAIFREMLKPFQHLPEDQRQKAVLLLIQDRMSEHFTYAYDHDSEGVTEFWSTPSHVLSDRAKNIDCEDYTFMAEFWAEIAQEEGLLPEEACFRNVLVPGHMIFIYDLPGDPPQRYVIDTATTFLNVDERNHWTDIFSPDIETGVDNDDDLVTLQEYLDKSGKHLLPDVYLGKFDHSASVLRDGESARTTKFMDQKWLDDINNNNDIAESISREQIAELQQQYIAKHGTPGLPDDWNEQSFSDYTKALTAKRMLGAVDNRSVLNGKDLNITPGQSRYLVGAYSQTLNRELTIEDMDLTKDEAIQLLGTYSPVLNRNFSHDDLKLSPDIPIPSDVDESMSDLVTPISESEEGSADLGDILQYKLGLNLDELTNPLSLAADVGGAAVGSVFVARAAQKRLNKVIRRRKNIMRANAIQERWKNIDLTSSQLKKEMNSKQFSDLSSLCFLECNQPKDTSWTGNKLSDFQYQKDMTCVKKILSYDREYLAPERLQDICNHVISMAQGTTDKKENKNLEWLKSFSNLGTAQENDWFSSKKELEKAKKILSNYGINLFFGYDKILGRFRSKSKAVSHRIKIDNKKLYDLLKRRDQLPKVEVIKELLDTYGENFGALGKMDKYDKRKIRHLRRDRNWKVGAAVVSVIPLIPASDAMKSRAYSRTANYRKKTKKLVNRRIKESLEQLQCISLTSAERNKIQEHLEQVRKLKSQHTSIKRKQAIANSSIHGVAAAASIPALLAGPIGSVVKSGVKIAAKTTVTASAAVSRYRKDEKLRKHNKYTTVKDIYKNYKKLYISAKEKNDVEKMTAITSLVKIGFGIDKEAFDVLVKSRLVENNQFKLSFSYADDKN
ncbi:MAG: hypothetical protein QS748_04355 [Candidatus Endonucleobacter bathymodioli]|uniref:Uncharacterized protein n=1 Tax=Candidatus Endonucleibacter bathymodioli TaxID=539814 RepID=A0AA90P009_9GAMM|nr:hypothetical protein [Candidatus Endonucleobacter bathymodioli]